MRPSRPERVHSVRRLGVAILSVAVVAGPKSASADPDPGAAASAPLIPVAPEPQPSPPEATPPAFDPRLTGGPRAEPSTLALTLGAGLNVVVAPGGVGPMADVVLAAALHPAGRWSVGIVSNLPVVSASVTAPPAGSTSVGATTLGGELAYAFGGESWLVHPDVALGAAAVLLRLDGTTSPSRNTSADVWMAAPLARGGLAFALTSDWRIRADATLGITVPEGALELAGHPLGTWGRPMFTGGASLEARLR